MSNPAGTGEAGAGAGPSLEERYRVLEVQLALQTARLEERRAQDADKKGKDTQLVRKVPGLVQKFGGEPKDYHGFRTEMQYALNLQFDEFPDEESRVAFVIGHLEKGARDWVRPLMAANSDVLKDTMKFFRAMDLMFSSDIEQGVVRRQLMACKQGSRSVREYWTEFTMLIHKLGWDLSAEPIQMLFEEGLSSAVKDELSRAPRAESMDQLTKSALTIGARQEARALERREGKGERWKEFRIPDIPEPTFPPAEPMEIGTARARAVSKPSEGGKKEGKGARKCYLCQQPGHFARVCPQRKEWQGMVGAVEGREEEIPKQVKANAWLPPSGHSSQAKEQ